MFQEGGVKVFLSVIADLLRLIAEWGANMVSVVGSYQPVTPECLQDKF